MDYEINRKTKLRCKEDGSNWYVHNVTIDEYDEAVITIREYGKKYEDNLEFHTVKHIRDNFIFEEELYGL